MVQVLNFLLLLLSYGVVVLATDMGPAVTGYRSLDGSGNHVAGNGAFKRPYAFLQASPDYGDQFNTPAGASRPSARSISNALFGAAPTVANTELSDFLAYFGQFIAHDIALTEASDNETMPILVSSCELVESRVDCGGMIQFNFSRALATQANPFSPRRVVNFETSFLDGSLIYGPNNETSALLRTFSQGLLKTVRHPFSNEEMLPFANNATTFQLMASARVTNTTKLFLAGDTRANVQPALQAIHTLFVREHNRRARYLQAQSTTPLSDEQLFQRARAWVIALLQKITYQQYLPTLLGAPLPAYQGYDVTKDPSLDHFFVAAAFRYGHSAISPLILRLDEMGQPIADGHLLLRDHFFRTDALIQSNGSLDDILRGLTFQADQVIDTIMTDELRNHFTDKPYDLASLNIMRGRDFGLSSYVDLRSAFGLDVPTSFEEIDTSADVQQQLASVYADVSQIDAYAGGLAETHATPSHLGPLFTQSLIEQFTRLRDADRFWYERNNVLQPGELQELDSWNIGRVVQENTNIQVYPSNPFTIYRDVFKSVTTNTNSNSQSTVTVPLVSNLLKLTVKAVTDTQLEFQLCAGFSGGWIAIGFNPTSLQMTGSDILVARQVNGQWQVQDYYANGNVAPLLDQQQDATNVADASAACGTTQGVTFRRLATTSDSANDVPIVKDSQVNLIYAYVPSVSNFDYHGPSNRGGIQAVLWSSTASTNTLSAPPLSNAVPTVNVLYYHGFIMFFTFSVIYPIAVYLIRYMTTISAKYVLVHRLFMSFGSMAAILGVSIVFVATGTGYIQTRPHALFGVILFSHMLLNLVLGTLSMQHWYFVRRNQRVIRFIHRINGWILFTGGWVNSVLGLMDLGAGALVYGYIVWIVAILVAYLVMGEFGLHKKLYAWYLVKPGLSSAIGAAKGNKRMIGFSWSEINERVAQGAQWIVISGNIYEVCDFIEQHPGGRQLILESIGTDATRAFYGTISATLDFTDAKEDEHGLLGFIPKQMKRKSDDDKIPTVTDTNATRLKARPKNLHSNVAMHRLHGMFVGYVKNYDDGDEDDLMALVNQTLGKQDFKLQKKGENSGNSRSQASLSPEELHHVLQRREISNDLLNRELKLLSTKAMTPGLKEEYYRNLRLLSKTLVVKEEARDKVYRFRFAFERPSHALVTIPGDTFEFLIFDREMKTYAGTSNAVTRFYTPIHVKQIGHLDLIIKVYEKGKMTSAINKLAPGDVIRVRGPVFHKAQLNTLTASGCYPRVVLIAAGSGITPMLLLLEYYQRMKRIQDEVNDGGPEEVILITAQHSVYDLILDKELDQLAANSDGFIRIIKFVSQAPPSSVPFTGYVGKLDETALREHVPFVPVKPSNIATRHMIQNPSTELALSSTSSPLPLLNGNVRSRAILSTKELENPKESANPTSVKRHHHLFVCGPVSFNESMKEILVKKMGFGEEDVTIL